MNKKENLRYQFIYRPGLNLSQHEQKKLVEGLRRVAELCFSECPSYQALSGEVHELERNAIMVARDKSDKIVGFCSSLLLPVDGIGEVLHLGLTCVSPETRGQGLTHKLTSKLLFNLLLGHAPLKGLWVSNVACVLSSLGNVALYFEKVYPSPFAGHGPCPDQIKIAKTISDHYRTPLAINEDSQFDLSKFVFESSVEGSVFQKNSNDRKYHHRKNYLTQFYRQHMDIDRGDEVLQIGRVSLLTLPKYILKKLRPLKTFDQLPATP